MDSNGRTNMDIELSEMFGIDLANVPAIIEDARRQIIESNKPEEKEEPTETFEYVQENLKKLSRIGIKAIEELAKNARESEQAGYYQVLATAQTSTANVLKLILENENARKITDNKIFDQTGPKTVTNNTIVLSGSTEDLLDAVNKVVNVKATVVKNDKRKKS